MNEEKLYILNPAYYFRKEGNRVYLLSRSFCEKTEDINLEWRSIIHPVYAMLLSFFSEPLSLKKGVLKVRDFLEITYEVALNLVSEFICNSEEMHSEYNGAVCNFPKNVIVEVSPTSMHSHRYTPVDFKYDKLQMDEARPNTAPFSLMVMFNNHCFTNCIYCYADKQTSCGQMPLEYFEKVLEEADRYGVSSLGVLGGEFFLYPHWRDVLEKMKDKCYMPSLISTKVPMREKDILDFGKYPIALQVSLDSVCQQTLDKMVGPISNYAKRMQESILSIDKYRSDRKFQIATVLTRYNGTIEELENLFAFVSRLKNLSRWEIRVGFKSLYSKSEFDVIKLPKERFSVIEEWIENKKKTSDMNILWSKGQNQNFFQAKDGASSFVGARCSANYSHMVILPNGDVTICEQLYWNPRFLLGNIVKQDISEIWNSPKALALAHRRADSYSEDSSCKRCSLQEKCDSVQNKCYANILKVYGDEHWDYPDPRCYYAPRAEKAINSYF